MEAKEMTFEKLPEQIIIEKLIDSTPLQMENKTLFIDERYIDLVKSMDIKMNVTFKTDLGNRVFITDGVAFEFNKFK